VEIKCQLDTTEVIIADLIACSTCFGHHYAHHQELKSIIQWLLPMVFRAVVFKLLVWCGAEGYVSGLQDAALLLLVYFWSWVDSLLVLGCRPLSAANRDSNSKVSVSNPSYISLRVLWMEIDSEIYDGWL